MGLTKVTYSMIDGAVVNVLDFGAVGDGVTDDTVAIKNAIVAATPITSSVLVNPTAIPVYAPHGNYLISEVITIPPHVNLVGDGKSATVFTCANASSGIAFGTRTTDCRGSLSSGFTVDGNNVATNPLYIGLCVERTFSDIVVAHGVGIGLLVEAAQNNLFTNINAAYNPINIQLDYGAGHNTFIRCELDTASTHNLFITQSGTSPYGAFVSPTNNSFYSCILERASVASLSGHLYQDSGTMNLFVGCTISGSSESGASALIKLRNNHSHGSTIQIVNAFYTGNFLTTGFDIDGGVSVYSYGATYLENCATAFIIGDWSSVEIERLITGPTTTIFQNQPGGVKSVDQLLRTTQQQFTNTFEGQTNTTPIYTSAVKGDTYSRFELHADGTILAGSGSSGTDVSIYRSVLSGKSGWQMTGPLKIGNEGAAVSSGAGAPTLLGYPNGSIYMRTDGSGTNDNLYVRRGGVWVGIA